MSWERTEKMRVNRKPVNEEDLSVRKPHPLFKEHKYLEQEVLRAGWRYPEIFKTYVVASAIPYGYEEDRLNYLFDLGWRNNFELPVLGDGHNVVPLIHIEDLAMIVFNCMVKIETSSTYLIASERNPPTLLQITEIVSRGLTTGNIFVHPKNEALPLNISLHEDTYAMLISDLLLEPNIHLMTLPWKYNNTFILNIASIIDEYIDCRNLNPFNVIVCGPPCTGKSTIAQRLAQLYDLRLITVQETVKTYVEVLEALELASPTIEVDDVIDDSEMGGEEAFSDRPKFKNELDELLYSIRVNGGVPEDRLLVGIMKKRLKDKDILNHGYVIDGWPETLNQAKEMFGEPDKEEEILNAEISVEGGDDSNDSDTREEFLGEDDGGDEVVTRNVNINPRYIIQLSANYDDILFKVLADKDDLMRKNPSSLQLASKMESYKELESTCYRAFDFFDNNCLDMKVMILQTDDDPCPSFGKSIKKLMLSLGPPSNKGFLKKYLEEYSMIIKEEEDIRKTKMKAIAEDIERMDIEYFRTACLFMDKWNDFKETTIKEKSDCGSSGSTILPQDVFDVAVKALTKFKESSPDDHFEFLAEYFLRLYEEQKGQQQLPSTKDQAANFRKCIATLLEFCDAECLTLLPQAVSVIQKYQRFAKSKGMVLSPTTCMDELANSKKSVRDSIELGNNEDVVENQSSTSFDSLKNMSFKMIAQLLNKSEPLLSDNADQIKSNIITDNSLKNLLKQLRQLSCEIRYRLKKRGVEEFDDDSSIGNLDKWPNPILHKECTGELQAHCPSQFAIIKKNASGNDIISSESELQDTFQIGGNKPDAVIALRPKSS